MLVTLKDILNLCEAKRYAVGSFNTPNLEAVMAVIEAAEELNVPVIIQHAQVHEEIIPMDIIGPIMIELAKKAKVPVAVHLDHGETVDYIYRALKLGFTSVMYDGSVLPYEENLANTQMVVSLAKQTGASVEAEIGSMGKRETGTGSAGEMDPEKVYTDPDQAADFVARTGVDALACSFGTTHGVYLTKPKLDFSVVENVRKKANNIPVVMHGGSGVSREDFQEGIRKGVRKINYYTYMAMAGGQVVESQFRMGCIPVEKDGKAYKYCYSLVEGEKDTPIMYHDIVKWGTNAMKENCKAAMEIFAMK